MRRHRVSRNARSAQKLGRYMRAEAKLISVAGGTFAHVGHELARAIMYLAFVQRPFHDGRDINRAYASRGILRAGNIGTHEGVRKAHDFNTPLLSRREATAPPL